MTMTTIYQELKAAGCEMDHHESDLYVRCDEAAQAILKEYEFRENVSTFVSQHDSRLWWDIPFAFDPFWEAKS